MKLFIPLFVYIYITKKVQLLLSLFYFKFMGYSVYSFNKNQILWQLRNQQKALLLS
jgi:hypothetical protein